MKKLIAMLLAVMMLLTAAAAFAEETVVYDGSFTKKYTGALPVDDTLKFDVTFVKETITGSTEAPAEPLIIVPNHDVVSGDDNINNVEFTYIQPEEYGNYVYKITEDKTYNTNPNVIYDDEAIFVAVNYYINDKGEDTVRFTMCNNPDGVSPAVEDTDDADTKPDQFVNDYKVGGFSVEKQIEGNAGNIKHEFDVEITFVSDQTLEGLSMSYSNGTESTSISDIGDLAEGEPEFITITIGHNETITFSGVPYGVTVTVEETNRKGKSNLNGYVPEYFVNDGKFEVVDGAYPSVTVDNDTVDEIKIVNTKTSIVPTGVYMDYIPYVVLLAVAVIAIVAIVAKNRARSREDD